MHSHDRTLIAKLGFADPDKREPLHELACQFLTQPETAIRFAIVSERPCQEINQTIQAEFQHFCSLTGNYRLGRQARYSFARFRILDALLETPISKGDRQYRTTIGFIDVSLKFCSTYTLSDFAVFSGFECSCCKKKFADWPEKGPHPENEFTSKSWNVNIEVKIARIPVSDAIRQIALYREYVPNVGWGLATPWPISQHEKKALDDLNIGHILLGEGFERFCQKAKELPNAKSDFVL